MSHDGSGMTGGLAPGRWWLEIEAAAVLVLVGAVYFSRMTLLPACGEETRVAEMAGEMIERGDWLVPRQQGSPFPERPPLGAWSMGLLGLARGEIDLVAIRLPSVLAIVATSLLVYGYARRFLTRFGAMSSALVFATFGQVLQMGRLGESEPLFIFWTTASLLIWHWGYVQGWRDHWLWIVGYSLAAVGALTKGPQAPVYFAAASWMFLLIQGEWRRLITWSHLAGIAAFAAILSLWVVPFYFAAGPQATADVWTILARKRVGTDGLVPHLGTYPLETLACLLPWSPLLLQLFHRRLRESLRGERKLLLFVLTAVAVTYPSVWLAAEARSRYYMPMYPCLALLIGAIIQHSASAGLATSARRGWDRYLLALGLFVPLAAGIVLLGGAAPIEAIASLAQPPAWAAALALAAAATTWLVLRAWRDAPGSNRRPEYAVAAVAAFFGFAYVGVFLNIESRLSNDMSQPVARLQQRLPQPENLVSLGPISHRFAYYYGRPIRELAWPESESELEAGIEYFCFDRRPEEEADGRHLVGRGMYAESKPCRLPFDWEMVDQISYARHRDKATHLVVIGRMVRPPAETRKVDCSHQRHASHRAEHQ